jgi:hypothetical protein
MPALFRPIVPPLPPSPSAGSEAPWTKITAMTGEGMNFETF